MNEIRIFSNPSFGEIRTTTVENEPMFCLVDVCKSLDLGNPSQVKQRLKRDGVISNEVGVQTGMKSNGTPAIQLQQLNFISEPNLYKCIFQSRKKEAEQFQDWVCSEVLPSIRKNGAYLTQDMVDQVLMNPDTIIQLATQLKEERAQKEMLQVRADLQAKELKYSAPKVEYFDTVLQSESTYPITIIAKELGMTAERLNQALKNEGVQFKTGSTWVLSSKYQERGFTKTKTHTYTRSDGSTATTILTVWTEKGRFFIHNLKEVGKI